jgi:HAD superfamily hydrolase (TIGR01509 family)
MLKALIFDVDGTLAETEEIHRDSFNMAFKIAGLNWHWDKACYAKLLSTTGGKERIARFGAEQKLPQMSVEALARLHLSKNQFYAETVAHGGLSLRPGVARVIKDAKDSGLKLGIATTTSRSNLDALLRCCFGSKCDDIFDAIVCGEDVRRKKPDPEVYQLCLSRLDVVPAAALAFEDSGVGLKAALAAGIRTVVTPSSYTRNDDFSGAEKVQSDLDSFVLGEF